MINLLPPAERENLIKEARLRLFFVWGVFVLFFLMTLSLVLFSINVYLAGETASYKILIDYEQQKSTTLEAQNTEKEIGEINKQLAALHAFYQGQPKINELLKKISELIPEEAYLNSLSLDPIEGDGFRVSLTGHSETREALLELKKSLESDQVFKGIYFPPSNWVKPSDVNFSASFEMTP